MFDESSNTRGMTSRPVVLSIRPTFIERILNGTKTIELRRRFPESLPPAVLVLLYSTAPVQALVGWGLLDRVVRLPLPILWRRFGSAASVTRDEFDAYFHGTDVGCALSLKQVRQLPKPIQLTDLKRRFDFSPPQSYCYWKESLAVLADHDWDKAPTGYKHLHSARRP